ncbi:MAG: hypothetical protein HRU32_12230 [Rhodobacteraceae bacterium]|nr:hypothetical protein [Paracoccaceae bacterium]
MAHRPLPLIGAALFVAACAVPPVEEAPEVFDAPPEPRPVVAEVVTGPLGETVASLGDPGEAGLWLKTPLVDVEQPGRVTTAAGRSQGVTLIPIAGVDGAGSRLSLAGYQALGLSPADLVPLNVTGG